MGCASTTNNSATVTTPTPTTAPTVVALAEAVSIPATAVATTTSPISTTSTPAATITTIGASSVAASADSPQVNNLQFTTGYLTYAIDNCDMQDIFPQVASDPKYGMQQTPPKIIGLSSGEINVFLRDYTEGGKTDSKVVGSSHCQGRPVDPQWNFVKVSANVVPRNARPANYTVAINVQSKGKTIAQFSMNETLTLDQPDTFETYIPLKSNEMSFFDGVNLVYQKNS